MTILPPDRKVASDKGNKYQVVQVLGRGGNSEVYLVLALSGTHRGLLFALNVFFKVGDATRLARFHEEAEFLQNVDHPSIMSIYDSGKVRGQGADSGVSMPFVVCEYFPHTLGDFHHSQLWMPQKVMYILQLLSALGYLQRYNPPIVHRDIKPANIFVKSHSCALGDFGLMKAQVTSSSDDRGIEILKQSSGPGMPKFYRTPDLVKYANHEAPVTPASDIFQLGLVAAEIFTGRNPLKGTRDLYAPVELEPLRELPGNLARSLRDAITGMLEFEPEQRGTVEGLTEQWEGIMGNVIYHYNSLEGRVF